MLDGVASHTARSVAARRLSFARVPADYGDPRSDLALSADVAAGLVPSPGRMQDYIRARTAFFDQVVVGALAREVEQVVVGAAGYDGRSLRYAKPGVRWFEVDHPATQADKRERIARLGIDASHVRFIAADFTADPVAERLLAAGLDPREPALFLYEGIAVYLAKEVNESVLAQFRSVTISGSVLAISVSLAREARAADSRAAFRARVAALGEPANGFLERAEASALLARAGWQVAGPRQADDRDRHDRLQAAGLLTARAIDVAVAPAPSPVSSPELSPEPVAASPPAPLAVSSSAPSPVAVAVSSPGPAGASSGRPAVPSERGVMESPSGPAVESSRSRSAVESRRPTGASLPGPVRVAVEGSGNALPLSALLSRALVAFTIEADNEAEHQLPNRTSTYGLSPGSPSSAPWLISLAMWASSLRFIPDDGLTVAQLRGIARTGSNLAGLRRWRYVTFDPEPTRGKQPSVTAIVRLTAQGQAAREGWAPIGGLIESRWHQRLGARVVEQLRSALTAVAAQLPEGLPDCLPIAGYGLLSRPPQDATDFPWTAAVPPSAAAVPPSAAAVPPSAAAVPPSAAAVPPSAVPASSAASATGAAVPVVSSAVAELPLWTLLSRVLLAFAVEFENAVPLSLAVAANLLRVLTPDGVRSRDLPALSGTSREAVAMAMGIATKRGLVREGKDPDSGRWRVARLTPRGQLAQDAYYEIAADIEAHWRARYGPQSVGALRAVLERLPEQQLLDGTDAYPEGWRAQLERPAVLPHYPMILHRGAFPDGS